MRNIVLLGFMGAGKTTVAQELRRLAGLNLIDTDDEIVKKDGREIRDIFREDGETAFRDMETELLRQLSEMNISDTVISVGGGLPMREENRKLMKDAGCCFYLKAPADVLAGRLQNDLTRPVLEGKSGEDLKNHILGLMKKREEKYLDAADEVIDTQGLSVRQTAEKILAVMEERYKRI
ncbi:MAG: shikimate kinase [Lachnospiraceae bacterium]|jgi:shikimate kinase